MSTNTIIQQGKFTSTGSSILIPLRSEVTWMNVYNSSSMASATNGDCQQAYWQFGMAQGAGILYKYVSASTALNATFVTSGGFTYVDTSAANTNAVNATITAISTSTPPTVTNTGVNGLVAGSIVKITNANGGAYALNGIEWVVGSGSLTNTTFQLLTAPTLSTAATSGSWQLVSYAPIYYPQACVVVSILSVGNVTSIATNVNNNYKVGQQIRLNIVDPIYGAWTALNGRSFTVTAIVDDYSFDIDADLSSFGTLNFPVTATSPFTPAQVAPVGQNTAYSEAQNVNILSDATVNTAQVGLILQGGAGSPAGASGDVIYWTAGTSFSIDNQ